MARRKRTDFPGAWHHVINRGARHEAIFRDDEACSAFLSILAELDERFGVEVHAYALMPNHFHLLVRSRTGQLSRAMRHLCGVYTQYRNRVHGWDGPLFRGRFRSQLVTDPGYLRHLVAYLHLNPVKARLVSRPDDECWTSHRAHLGLERPPSWLHLTEVARLFGQPDELNRFVREVHQGAQPWPEGFEALVELFRPGRPPKASSPAAARPAAPETPSPPDLSHLLEIIATITDTSLETLRRSARGRGANPARRFAALALIDAKTLTHSDIANALTMSVRQVSTLAARSDLDHLPPPLDAWMQTWRDRKMQIA